jgi:hypothetical protein
MDQSIVEMARAAQHDDRLSDGALYGKLADKIEQMDKALREADIYLSVLLAEVANPEVRRGMRDALAIIDAARCEVK